jgi:hypothetical protein
MTETPDLKPCPFCGFEAVVLQPSWGSDDHEAGCFNGECPVEPHAWAENKDEAIAAWNTRAVDPAAIREAALREAAAVCIGVSNDVLTQVGREHAPFMKATAEDCSKTILALIGEKK